MTSAGNPESVNGVWRFGDESHGMGGVVVRCGPEKAQYYWVVCPAASTLVLSRAEVYDGCSIGIECDWDEIHERAAAIIRADRSEQ